MQITVALPADYQRRMIEGPTAKQAKRMAATAQQWRESPSFQLNCEALQLEADLVHYGFDPRTGRRTRKNK